MWSARDQAAIEKMQERRADKTTTTTLTFPGHEVAIHHESDDDWQVWLNTEDGSYTGLCIGSGETQEAAVAEARQTLADALTKLLEVRP